jgi:hypothetical protein
VSDTYITVIATHDGAREKFKLAMTHAKCMLDNGEAVELRVGPALKSIGVLQRGFLHAAVLPQIAEQAYVGEKRERFTAEVWKEFFHRRFIPDRWVMRKLPGAKRATPHRERVSSESLGVRRYAEWIDQIIDTAIVEHGVVFVFEPSQREAVRHVVQPRRAAAQ